MSLAPIACFVYNRPLHTLRCLESLLQNKLSEKSKLFIFCDGPGENDSGDNMRAIEEVNKIILSKKWCQETQIIKQEKNIGLADSIVHGVTRLTGEFGKVIVVEDDLVLSPVFLQYINDALDLYENEERVMHITGYMYPQLRVPLSGHLADTFFSSHMNCWGWATWKRAWNHFTGSAEVLLDRLNEHHAAVRFNLDFTSGIFLDQLLANKNGKLKTWAVKWGASIFLKDGLCLFPGNSLVKNMGTDGTGTHQDISTIYARQKLFDSVMLKPVAITESPEGRARIKYFFHFLYKPKTLVDKITEKLHLIN